MSVAADVPLHYLSLSDVCRRLKSGEFSAVAVTEAMLARIGRLDPELKGVRHGDRGTGAGAG